MKKLRLILLFSVGIIFTFTLTAYAQDYTIIQLTDNDRSDYGPQINDNNQVAWFGGDIFGAGGTDNEVFFYDGLTTYQITDNNLSDDDVWINNTGHILWSQSELDGTNEELFLFDGTDITQLTNSETDFKRAVDFNNNDFVVWEEYIKMDVNAVFAGSFLYDGSNITKFVANLDKYPNAYITLRNPKINNQGQVVLQGGIHLGFFNASAIFLYDGSTLNKVISLTTSPFFNNNPQINDNGYVVWDRSDGTDIEIFLYDGSTITQLTNNDYDDREPQINNNGHVVWHSSEGIFLYDGSTTTKLSDSWSISGYYKINDNGYVAWAESDGNDWEIFLYDGLEIIQITNNDYGELGPQLNNNNYIVWVRQFLGGQTNFEIFLAIPGNPPMAEAGENIAISSEAVASTVIQGTASNPDSPDVLEYRWREEENILTDWNFVNEDGSCPLELVSLFSNIGTYTLTLEITDGQVTSTDEMILTIENSAPQAAACGGGVYAYGAEINLCGEVSDFDGDMLDYQWMEDTDVLCTGTVQALAEGFPVELPSCIISGLSLGQHIIALYVDDNINATVMSDINLEIVDTSVPTLAPVPSQSILWPPNHKMIDILIEANANDNSGLPVTLIATVASNEPEEDLGDGDMAPDWTIPVINQEMGLIQLLLRAERSGSGNGRVYSVVITATDDSNNSSSATVEIVVSHDNNLK
ncbi:MAG: hypothetical protein JRD93_18160 [Deltaproteobacteria bacterium]|nr:hypothetical protein [Deltaproteobacteria bacterium]